MYQLRINDLTTAQFLSQYWQKQPLLIKSGFSNFIDPIEPEELAGLAMEESIESRLITNHNDDWQAHHGPFEDFTLLTPENSTLLVQAVDHWHPEAAQLLTPFRFIPNWRIDDLMISYSTPGGGVGPHLDQYDVFIIQGQGKRHWRVGLPDQNLKQFAKNKSLLQVEPFEAIIDSVLEPGDILYIPPGCPHEGYAVENALNYSVGFRAPDQKDLVSSFADYLIDHELGNTRYSDPDLLTPKSIGQISDTEINNVRKLMQDVLADDNTFKHWFGTMISQAKHDIDLAPLDEPLSVDDLQEYLETSEVIIRAGGVRSMYQVLRHSILLSVNGESYTLPLETLESVKLLTDETEFTVSQIKESFSCLEFMKTLTKLISEGTYYLQEDDEFE
ncbi:MULTISPECIES: cupin domain-containing protein [Pseudoalteromonas]|uniref:50S ribosomal protein L16 arginine hydroxylase n=1 Tax=Pseudoalteromonas amylolytica TaxID=1859457 RepID=A0A1S1MUB3_9GAMM|nr:MULTISPECIES: cupin domain-containing protein [Pseudoalteromonas]OHU86972.1 50S ribosomal protein L16 arginine hydroxylase [Pseudoalteromonas sp. JW3]OHU88319.1 50S ribosomal protein L16 arginine hydroxylase [Pseudoalteromonas amylolytica]